MTIMTIYEIAVIAGGIHCWTGCAKEKKYQYKAWSHRDAF